MSLDFEDAAAPVWSGSCSVLLLDLDGTLVDSAAAVLRGWQDWARWAGVPADEIPSVVHGRSAAATILHLLPDVSADELHKHIQRVLRIQELDPEPAYPMAGAARLIEDLSPPQWAVVTGCSRGMAAARLAAGGLPTPSVLVTDEDVASGKPDPEGYLRALWRLGVDAGDAIAVEDAPAGIEAARAAGIRSVAVTTTHARESLTAADAVVTGLDAIRVFEDAGRLRVALFGLDAG
ncbi:HAD-IA family hydrolase [Dactylosporangium sp. NPDC051485]|uniref:HAD-IA family hydrolase n=1 Tax=Dactylosporangium sp. NPDC051485 TaxID=3154846 RepID=UPI00342B2005